MEGQSQEKKAMAWKVYPLPMTECSSNREGLFGKSRDLPDWNYIMLHLLFSIDLAIHLGSKGK